MYYLLSLPAATVLYLAQSDQLLLATSLLVNFFVLFMHVLLSAATVCC